MADYELAYSSEWDKHFAKLDRSVQEKLFKKILQLKTGIQSRHLKHGLPFFVEEAGGYRIVYRSDDVTCIRKIFFAGSHKDYEKWYKNRGG